MQHTAWHEARSIVYRLGADSVQKRLLPLADAVDAVLAEDICTPIPLPHYDSSAMDGYAVAGAWPWRLRVPKISDSQANRHQKTVDLSPGEATPILTGGLLPSGTDSILRLEQAALEYRGEGTFVLPTAGEPQLGKDIRRAGEELAAGTTVASAGERITPRLLAFLAVCGFDELPVCTLPTVALAYTGNEVVTSGVPAPGEVRDAYSLSFPRLITDCGARLLSTSRLHDDTAEIHHWFTGPNTAGADLLLLTGGSSTSEVDLLRGELEKLGATYHFEAVAVRPGHPCLCAQLPDGRLVIGLPGNPLAAYSSLFSYLPAYCAGRSRCGFSDLLRLPVAEAIDGFAKSDLRLVPARIKEGGVSPLLRRAQSHMLSDFARADCLLVVPPAGACPGDLLELLPLPA